MKLLYWQKINFKR